MAAPDPIVGIVIGDRYRIARKLGSGGFGAVYEAEHVSLDRRFALKVLRRDLEHDEAFAKRFEREARLTSSLDHPHIVSVTDFGRDPRLGLYFVMDYLRGQDLMQRIEAAGALPQAVALALLRQVVDAFVYAHGRGVVHRDVKSANVFLQTDGARRDHVKVLDFGIARLQEADEPAEGSRLTRTGMVMGSAAYMAPEQALAQVVDHRTDIYSLGIVLYEALTGDVPFRAPSTLETLNKQIREAPVPPSQVRPELHIHPLTELAVLRCLQKKPEARYQRTEDLAAALAEAAEAVATGRGATEDITSTVANLRADMVRDGALLADSAEYAPRRLAASLTSTDPTPGRDTPLPAPLAPRRTWLLVLLGVLLGALVAGVFVAGALFGPGRQATPVPQAQPATPAASKVETPAPTPPPVEVKPAVATPAAAPASAPTPAPAPVVTAQPAPAPAPVPPPVPAPAPGPAPKPVVKATPKPAVKPAPVPTVKPAPAAAKPAPAKGANPWDGI